MFRIAHYFPPISFQLTPSRRATLRCSLEVSRIRHFNSRPHGGRRLFYLGYLPRSHFNSRPHGGRQLSPCLIDGILRISTHALTEGDPAFRLIASAERHFNSRPHGGRRLAIMHSKIATISTHALTEGDKLGVLKEMPYGDFNSRPHGGRHVRGQKIKSKRHFNSRPHGGRQIRTLCTIPPAIISTHALTEGDGRPRKKRRDSLYFNSRPHGGRQQI